MNKTALVILALALAFSTSAYGMVFSWKDSSGTKHYSNKRDEIPDRYRARAKPLYPEQTDSLPEQQGTASQPVRSVIAPTVSPAVQQAIPAVPPKTPHPVAAPAPPQNAGLPSAGRKGRRRPVHDRSE